MAKLELSPKQEKFCQCIVSGMTQKDSYLAAYDWHGSDLGARQESTKLMQREDIQARIQALTKPIQERIQRQVLSEREQKRELIKSRIQACVAKDDDAAAARWMDILNKMDSEYININRNIDDSSKTLDGVDTTTLKLLARDA